VLRLPLTLSLYIGRQYLYSVLFMLAVLMVIAGLLDAVELLRRGASKEAATFGVTLEMLFFKFPAMAEKLLPFAGLIGGMTALSRLTRTHELIVARAAGVSVWQFMAPAFLTMFLLGTLFVAVYNPLSAVMAARYEKLESKYLVGRSSLLEVSPSGLWLRQLEDTDAEEKEHIIHALSVFDQGKRLAHVTIFSFDANAQFLNRIDAKEAILEKGFWRVKEMLMTRPGKPAERMHEKILNTELTVAHIQDSFASPTTLSFWELPAFVKALEAAGFSALRHKLHLYVLASTPFMLCAMCFLAAAFSLRLPRRGGTKFMIAAGVFTGFLLYFLTDLIYAFGLSGSIPVALAAFSPSLIIMFVGGAALLHLEDG
jgi:lipopolysaccharide export system permease protein